MVEQRRVGFYGGTFDPPHFGHLNLGQELLEAHDLDEVWFSPAATSPDKLHQKATAASHRIEMVLRAVEGFSQFRVFGGEIERGGTSYTVETLRRLVADHAKTQFFLILSDETVPTFAGWQSPEQILELAPPLVGRRLPRNQPFPSSGVEALDRLLRRGFTDTAVMEVSATKVRARLQAGLPCGHMVPAAVLDYIEKKAIHFI